MMLGLGSCKSLGVSQNEITYLKKKKRVSYLSTSCSCCGPICNTVVAKGPSKLENTTDYHVRFCLETENCWCKRVIKHYLVMLRLVDFLSAVYGCYR